MVTPSFSKYSYGLLEEKEGEKEADFPVSLPLPSLL